MDILRCFDCFLSRFRPKIKSPSETTPFISKPSKNYIIVKDIHGNPIVKRNSFIYMGYPFVESDGEDID